MTRKKITVDEEVLRKSFGLDLNTIVANKVEASERCARAYLEESNPEFYLCEDDKLEEKFSDQYRNDLLVEFFGSLLATAIKTQYDLQKKEGKNPSVEQIVKDLLEGSLFGQVLPLCQKDISDNFSDSFVSSEMREVKEKIFKKETTSISTTKILFEQKHFAHVETELWQNFSPYLKEATFLTQDNLIRLIIYRETGFELGDHKNLKELNEYISKNFLPSKNTVFRVGLKKLLEEIEALCKKKKIKADQKSVVGAEYLWDCVQKANKKSGREFIIISSTRQDKFLEKVK